MDELSLDQFMGLIIQDKGGTKDQYNQLMDDIAYHETGAHQRMDPKAIQRSRDENDKIIEGPGRGLFQFEIGDDKGGNTASNRTVKYLQDKGVAIPKWLNDIWEGKKSVDATKLTADQQKILFLGNHKGHPTADFSKLWSGEQTTQDFWLNNHWSGKNTSTTEQVTARINAFNASVVDKNLQIALKKERDELEKKKGMAPWLAKKNDLGVFDSKVGWLNKIFGSKDSSLVK